MGLFDYVHCSGPEFVCSEGHDLTAEEFQSKDFGCTMGDVSISSTSIDLDSGKWGDGPPERPLLGRFYVYCTCRRCPAFIQAKTANMCSHGVTFCIEVVDDRVRSIKRASPPTAEWLESEPKQSYMAGCLGPMPYDEAQSLRMRMLRGEVPAPHPPEGRLEP